MPEPAGWRAHETDDRTCWCGPELLQPCRECPDTMPDQSCWRCAGRGLVPVFDDDAPVIVVHREVC